MKWEQAKPIIEGKLHTWAIFKESHTDMEIPDPPISSIYQGMPPKEGKSDSQQEAYMARAYNEYHDAMIIDRTLKKMDDSQRNLIEMRYLENSSWKRIEKSLCMSRRSLYRLKDSCFVILAYEFGFLSTKVPRKEKLAHLRTPNSVKM